MVIPERQATITRCLDRLASAGFRAINALEIGRVRRASETVGQSTPCIARHPIVSELVSVDCNEATERLARDILGPDLAGKVRFVNADSCEALAALAKAKERFTFAYLDGASDAEICLSDLLGAIKVCHGGAVIVLDDTDPACDVKGKLTVPWAKSHPGEVVILETIPGKKGFNGQTVLEVR